MWERNLPFGNNFCFISEPQKGLKNMPFGVPADTNMEELQPCPTGLFQGKERYPKY